jgi:hypothetical protein
LFSYYGTTSSNFADDGDDDEHDHDDDDDDNDADIWHVDIKMENLTVRTLPPNALPSNQQ